MPGDLPHEVLQASGVDLADRRQARLAPFGRPDISGKNFDAREAGGNEFLVPGDGIRRIAAGVENGVNKHHVSIT